MTKRLNALLPTWAELTPGVGGHGVAPKVVQLPVWLVSPLLQRARDVLPAEHQQTTREERH
jgi:hypothetical protein